MPALFQEAPAVNTVERVGKVYLDKNRACVVPVSSAPLARDLQASLCAKRLGDPQLEWEEMVERLVFGRGTQTLGGESAQCLANSNGPHAVVLFREGHEGGTCQARGYLRRRISACQECYH